MNLQEGFSVHMGWRWRPASGEPEQGATAVSHNY